MAPGKDDNHKDAVNTPCQAGSDSSCYPKDVGLFHDPEKRADAVLVPVYDVAEDIQKIAVGKIRFVKQTKKLLQRITVKVGSDVYHGLTRPLPAPTR